MIVLDASAAVLGLLSSGESRAVMSTEDVRAPHLIDSEVASTLRRRGLRSAEDDDAAGRLLETWARLGVRRHATSALLPRIWDLRHHITAYDATYVVLATALDCALVTADARLARASGLPCEVVLVGS